MKEIIPYVLLDPSGGLQNPHVNRRLGSSPRQTIDKGAIEAFNTTGQGPSQAKIIMNLTRVATVLASAMLYPWPSLAEPITEQPISAEVVLRAQSSWTGIDFQYPEGTPEITVLEITFQPGAESAPHTNQMPGAAIVLQGSLFCKAENGIERTFQQGDAFPTSFRTNPHTCKNTGSTITKALVFYAGEQESASSYTDYKSSP